MRRSQQHRHIGVVHEASLEPTFIAGVLQKSTHQIRHAWNHFTHWNIFTDAQTHLRNRKFQSVRHAVQHLQLNGGGGQTQLLRRCQSCRNTARIVATQRQLGAAIAHFTRAMLQENFLHALKARVGFNLGCPHWTWPTLLLRVNGFVIPVRAFDQAHRDHAATFLRPRCNAARVIIAAAQIRLHGKARLKWNGLATTHKQFKREVLQRELFHVKVHQHFVGDGRLQNWTQRFY